MRVRVLLLGVLALGLGAAELEISLRPSAVIDSPQVHLADIAALSDVDGELQETLAGVQVRRLPDLGDYTIDGHEVQVLLRRQLGLQAAVTGTSQVRRASKRFSASELDELAIAHLKDRAEDRQIKVRVRRQAAAQTLPLDAQQPITIKAEPLTDAWWGDVPYRLRLMRGEQEVARTLCILEVNAWREVPVVTRNIARGSVLSLQDMTLQRVEVSPRAGGDGLTLEKAAGQEAIRHIPAGTVLGAGWIRPIPDVQQGTTILLHYHGAGFTLAVHAEALTAGLTGERVRVRTDQGKTVHAEVTGTNEAAIYEVQTPESRQP